MLKCKGCGADIPFVPGTQNYICPYCDTVHTHEELTEQEKAGEIRAEEHVYEEAAPETASHAAATDKNGRQIDQDKTMKVYVYTCPQCGGELMTTEETYATFCSYCGSSVLLSCREGVEEKPDYIIPFAITKEQAIAAYNEKIAKAYLAPDYIRHMDVEKIRGIYMPYWTYRIKVKGDLEGTLEESRPEGNGKRVTKYRVTATADAMGDGIEYDAASTFPDDLSQSAGPFHFRRAKRFDASYMSGFYADRGNMPSEAYAGEAYSVMAKMVEEEAAKRMNVAPYHLKSDLKYDYFAEKAMYPVWFVSARNHAENKVSYAVINGETGRIAMDVPVQPVKLLLGTLLFALPIFLLLYSLVVPTPRVTAIVTMLMALAGLVITGFVLENKALRTPISIVLNVLAALICLALFIVNPFRDELFFVGLTAANLMCLLSYVSIFLKNNKTMLRKLPQLGARGGDENA